ncbi:MAG: hypothetical protein LBP63_03080 [Prevotellaceae bacterium]|nr:hypothetical protein [Prevotellaceae bacterium]
MPMIISDFCLRRVTLAWLVILAVCNIITATVLYGLRTAGINFIFNFAVLIYMFLGVLLYVYIKSRKIATIKHYAGLGDVLFFLVLTPIFEFRHFVYFLIGSCLAALAWWLIIYVVWHKKRTVPLVGISGCTFFLFIMINILI